MDDITAMASDLEEHLKAHARAAVQSAQDTARLMEARIASMSSPAYGLAVLTRIEPLTEGAKIEARVVRTNGVGTVFGGEAALEKTIAAHVEDIAKGGGFDRRG